MNEKSKWPVIARKPAYACRGEQLSRCDGEDDPRQRSGLSQEGEATQRSVFKEPSSWVADGPTGLEIPHDTGHRAVLGQLHDRWQRHALAAGLGHESRPQAVPAKIALQAGQARPPLHDLADGGGGQGRAEALLPEPPENRPSVIPDASSQSCKARAARSSTGLSGVEVAVTPACWVLLCSSR